MTTIKPIRKPVFFLRDELRMTLTVNSNKRKKKIHDITIEPRELKLLDIIKNRNNVIITSKSKLSKFFKKYMKNIIFIEDMISNIDNKFMLVNTIDVDLTFCYSTGRNSFYRIPVWNMSDYSFKTMRGTSGYKDYLVISSENRIKKLSDSYYKENIVTLESMFNTKRFKTYPITIKK